VNGCGCLDTRVVGHVCGRDGLPDDGIRWDDSWRDLPGLHDAVPRPVPFTQPTDGSGHGRIRQSLRWLRWLRPGERP
jgi:hypothetical protein